MAVTQKHIRINQPEGEVFAKKVDTITIKNKTDVGVYDINGSFYLWIKDYSELLGIKRPDGSRFYDLSYPDIVYAKNEHSFYENIHISLNGCKGYINCSNSISCIEDKKIIYSVFKAYVESLVTKQSSNNDTVVDTVTDTVIETVSKVSSNNTDDINPELVNNSFSLVHDTLTAISNYIDELEQDNNNLKKEIELLKNSNAASEKLSDKTIDKLKESIVITNKNERIREVIEQAMTIRAKQKGNEYALVYSKLYASFEQDCGLNLQEQRNAYNHAMKVMDDSKELSMLDFIVNQKHLGGKLLNFIIKYEDPRKDIMYAINNIFQCDRNHTVIDIYLQCLLKED